MEFNDRLVYVARNLVEYGKYGGDERKAIKIIQNYFPVKTEKECSEQFSEVCKVYKSSIEFATRHQKAYYSTDKTEFENLEKEFIKSQSKLPLKTVEHILGWVYNWHLDR